MTRALAAAKRPAGPLTLEDWAALDEDVAGELVDGVLEEEEMPTFLHEIVAMWFAALLQSWARARGGFVTGAETKLAIAPGRGRKPDVSLFLDAKPSLSDSVARVAPHLVLEVVSPRPRDARRDRVEKIGDYARAKARSYWVVDPQLRTLEIFRLGSRGRYVHALAAASGRLTPVPGCEGLSVDLDALWREVDEAAEGERASKPARAALGKGIVRGRTRRSRK